MTTVAHASPLYITRQAMGTYIRRYQYLDTVCKMEDPTPCFSNFYDIMYQSYYIIAKVGFWGSLGYRTEYLDINLH